MPPILTPEEHLARLRALPRPGEENILAYYEHRLGGISTAPRLMLMPLDDHLAHRGDGIFETIKYSEGRLYRLDLHLERMRRSAEGIALVPPCPWDQVRSIIMEVAAAGREKQGLMRVLMGRGPGGFGIDPADCPASSLYAVAYRFTPCSADRFRRGFSGFRTSIPAKQGYLARIKNANYLPNVLMIMEGRAKNAEVPFCFDDRGCLADSAVASLCLVDAQGTFVVPGSESSLPGTTVRRTLELLEGRIPCAVRPVAERDIFAAAEVLMLGTGPDCAAVTSYEGKTIGGGTEGPVARLLRTLISDDIRATGVPVPGLAEE